MAIFRAHLFRVHLSPNEETTLRRIATGILELGDVRQAEAERLITLGLVQTADRLLIPTGRGLELLQIEKPATAKPAGQRRLKRRRLPFGNGASDGFNPPDRSVDYRKRAEKAREKAARTTDDNLRAQLLQIAETWERMAECEEKHNPPRRAIQRSDPRRVAT